MSRFFFGSCRKLARTKTQQITYKASKHNGRTVFLRVLKGGGVNFFFYPLSSIRFTSSLFPPPSLFYLFHRARYFHCCCEQNRVYVPPGGTPLPPPLSILILILQGGAVYFVVRFSAVDGYGSVVWSRRQ